MKSNIKKVKRWMFSHQVETILIILSIILCLIGIMFIGLKAIFITLLAYIIYIGSIAFYQKYLKKYIRIKENEKSDSVKKKTNKNTIASKKTKTNNSVTSKTKKKSKGKKWWKVLLMVIFVMTVFVLIAAALFFAFIAIKAPTFDPNKLFSSEASILYDRNNEIIAKLGTEKREKITYDDLPEVFIDALIATEDSRFFQHNGFDLPRFTKASILQVISGGGGGASTLTMQVSKNAFTSRESSGIKGIIRKFTDIYMSIFQIEKKYTKQEIIEFYINNNLLGGNNYGVEQAAITYFGKSAKDMNLSEAALIAGIFQSPNAYNPLTKPENAEYRRSVVLKLMVRHGYITKEEADIANAIPVKNLVKAGNGGIGDDTAYQGFVDTVVSEVKENTGLNPYTTAMEIYTTMDRKSQDAVNDAMSGKTFAWENDVVQGGITVLDTKTGAIAAVGTNRDSSASGLLNHATFENQVKRHIGSTAKPLFDYAPAIEYNNATPAQLISDEDYQYSDGNDINNFDGGYQGLITYRTALAGSRNIPALKVFQGLKKPDIIEFVKGLGLSPEVSGNSLHEAHSIGGYNGESPLTIAAAYAAFGNGGTYNEPYSYTKIIYRDTNEEEENKTYSKQVMSEATAYIIQDMLVTTAPTALGGYYSNVNGWSYSAKTGTSNFDQATKDSFHLADDAINDLWVAAFNDEYTISVWYGYDKIYPDHYTHFGNMQHAALFNVVARNIWSRSSHYEMPNSVVSVTLEQDCVEPMLPSAYTPDSMKVSELFKKGTEPTETSKRFEQLDNVTGLTAESSAGEVTLSWKPSTSKWLKRDYITSYYKPIFSNQGFLDAAVNNRMGWNNSALGNLVYDIYENISGTLIKVGSTSDTKITLEPRNSGSTSFVVRTAYSNYKANQSTGVTKSVTINGTANYKVTINNKTITKGQGLPNDFITVSNACSLSYIDINGSKHTSWGDADSAVKDLNKGEYTVKASYTCGSSNKAIGNSGTLTIN